MTSPPQHHETCALRHHKAVAVRVERARGQFRARRLPAHHVETQESSERAVGQERIAAAGEHQVGGSSAQQLHAFRDGRWPPTRTPSTR